MNSAIKQCFCGEEPHISRHHGRDWIKISCSNLRCLRFTTDWGTEKMMIDKWNNRIPASNNDIEKLVKALTDIETMSSDSFSAYTARIALKDWEKRSKND